MYKFWYYEPFERLISKNREGELLNIIAWGLDSRVKLRNRKGELISKWNAITIMCSSLREEKNKWNKRIVLKINEIIRREIGINQKEFRE